MTRWRTTNKRRKRLFEPWWARQRRQFPPRYLGCFEGNHIFIVDPRIARDIRLAGSHPIPIKRPPK